MKIEFPIDLIDEVLGKRESQNNFYQTVSEENKNPNFNCQRIKK
jgi:hypothetical protein